MIKLPEQNHPARQLMDIASIAEMLRSDNRANLPTLRNALLYAASYFMAEEAAKELHMVCWKADGSIVLERIGNRGGHNTVWTFINHE